MLGYLLIADISGYTDFIKLHNMRKTPVVGNTLAKMYESHADTVITDLLESVIEKIEPVMQLNKLEGDAAFFFAEESSADYPSDQILTAMGEAQEAFKKRSAELTFVQACGCEPCLQSKNLRLKIVAHRGEFGIKKIRSFEELTGEDVILVHRMLKNSIKSNEYWLVTKQLADGLTPEKRLRFLKSEQTFESFNKVACEYLEFNTPEPKKKSSSKKSFLYNYLRQGAYFMKPSLKTIFIKQNK